MQAIRTKALGIRVTEAEMERLERIKAKMGLPSMPNTTLGHELLVLGMDEMEKRLGIGLGEKQAVVPGIPVAGKPSSHKKKTAARQAGKSGAVDV